ncbi:MULTISPECIES: hypothetical protein [unclassified Nocardia]|uniref:hypothetical protein n=1 Tax=unclassified Nocardia TaxID=2637762 RepID=UPI00278C5ADE|nr:MULTISPECIES: hypothetical protein [unclassified Nocardia]
MVDKLANTKAFVAEAITVYLGKQKWEQSDQDSEQEQMLGQEILNVRNAIRLDDPFYQWDGPPTEAVTDTNTKAYAAALYNAGPAVRKYAPYGYMSPGQTVLFGETGYYGSNKGFAGDLVAAIKADDPAWTP